MTPDFKKSTVDLLAKRSAYKCSNPDCRKATVGPNEDIGKAIVLGEAAHIYGARPGAKRYVESMTDLARSEITNALWLCRNCHKLIDSDDERFSAELLFLWRSEHERFLLSELGNISDKLLFEDSTAKLKPFHEYPQIVKRLVLDEPPSWEWRLAAELLRHLLQPHFMRLRDLQDGLYARPLYQLTIEEVPDWTRLKLAEFECLASPYGRLLTRLTKSFGEPGEKGDINEIHYVCRLIEDLVKQAVSLEESIYFVHVPEECEGAVNLLKNVMGSQILKLEEISKKLDEVVELSTAEHNEESTDTKTISMVITLELPDGWSKEFSREMSKIHSELEF